MLFEIGSGFPSPDIVLAYLISAGVLSGIIGGLIGGILTSRASWKSAIQASRLSYITAVLSTGENLTHIQRFLQETYDSTRSSSGVRLSDVTKTMWFVTAFAPAPKIREAIVNATRLNDYQAARTAIEHYLSGKW